MTALLCYLRPYLMAIMTLLTWHGLRAEPGSVDTSPLPLQVVPAFPELTWEGWQAVDADGRTSDFRLIAIADPRDGTDRLLVAEQRGVVHVFHDMPSKQTSKVFLDLRHRVRYDPNENEEGLLGFVVHPRFHENGEFFVYYTSRSEPHLSRVVRLRVDRVHPDRADAEFEEEILQIPQPYWNHNGGCMVFGPDGYLYLSIGDGGAANDPHGHGQNLKTLFGSICRIDVDHRSDGKNYAIPPDNPFADEQDKACPEIFAFGLRNVWGMSFDASTGQLIVADVGQNEWEEIDVVVSGGNYGWNRKEGRHDFGASGSDQSPVASTKFIDPIWEYDHEVGKSITGGHIYRASLLPELQGYYLYADFVSGRVWGLLYDPEKNQVLANRRIATPVALSISGFGVDHHGEPLILTISSDGQSLFRLKEA